jgi:hypothetical protein
MLLLDRLTPGVTYWRAVLTYCAHGGLQAVLDEYLHVLLTSEAQHADTDDDPWNLALRVEEALTLRPARYLAFNPRDHHNRIGITARFALRGRCTQDAHQSDSWSRRRRV